MLATMGYYHGAIDGRFGPLTEEAARVFQQAWDLPVDGEIGPMTMRTLAFVGAVKRVDP